MFKGNCIHNCLGDPTWLSNPLLELKRKLNGGYDDEDINNDKYCWKIWTWKSTKQRRMSKYELRTFRVLSKSQVPTTSKGQLHELQNGEVFVQERLKTNSAIIRYLNFRQRKLQKSFYLSMLQNFLTYWY